MSWQATTYVTENSRHKGGALLTLLMVANHANADGTGAWMSVGTLARETRMSERQVQRHLRDLEETGELVADGTHPRFGTVVYTVVMAGVVVGDKMPPPRPRVPVDNGVDNRPAGVTPPRAPRSPRGDTDPPKPSPKRPTRPEPPGMLKPALARATVDKPRRTDARDAFAEGITAQMTAISERIRSTDDEGEREELIDQLDKLKNLAPTASAATRRGERDMTQQCPVCSADPGLGCLEEIHALVASAPPPPTAADRAKAAQIASRLADGLPPYAEEEKVDGPRPLSEYDVSQAQAKTIRLWAEQATHVRNPYTDQASKNILAGLTGKLLRAGAPQELIFAAIREYGSNPTANPAFIGEWLTRAEIGVEISAHLARKRAETAASIGKGVLKKMPK